MNTTGQTDWRKEFGIGDVGPRAFFANKEELNAAEIDKSQVYVLRRAFDQLGIDGVFCTASVPLVYFKVVAQINTPEIALLVTGQYANVVRHGGMLGYVLDGDVSHAIQNVEANIRTQVKPG